MTNFLQWIYNIYTIFTDFIVLVSSESIDDNLLHITNLLSIFFVMFSISGICIFFLDKVKHTIMLIICPTLIITNIVFGILSFLLLFEVPFLPEITPSFTHEHYSNIVIKPNKKQIYTNNSNVQWLILYNEGPFGSIATNEFTRGDILSSFPDNDWEFVILEGNKGDSTNRIVARLQKENVHITKTGNAKKYPEYASYKVTKIETKDGSLTETSYHKSRTIKFKELYLEIIADVQPEQLKDAIIDTQNQQNKKDINKLLN